MRWRRSFETVPAAISSGVGGPGAPAVRRPRGHPRPSFAVHSYVDAGASRAAVLIVPAIQVIVPCATEEYIVSLLPERQIIARPCYHDVVS